jgi:hypothetical protein
MNNTPRNDPQSVARRLRKRFAAMHNLRSATLADVIKAWHGD